MTIHVLIVDDHQIVREGVKSLFATVRPEWSASEAGDESGLLEAIEQRKPDVIVMDITMPQKSGLELVPAIRKAGFDRPVLFFTMHSSEQLEDDARRAGGQGYVLKSQAVDDLVTAIEALLAGGTFYGKPSIAPRTAKESKSGLSFRISLRPAFA